MPVTVGVDYDARTFTLKYRVDSGAWQSRTFALGDVGENDAWRLDIAGLGVGKEVELSVYYDGQDDFVLTDMDIVVRRLGR